MQVLGYGSLVKGELPGGQAISISSAPEMSPKSGSYATQTGKAEKKGPLFGGSVEQDVINSIVPTIMLQKPVRCLVQGQRMLEIRKDKNGDIFLTAPPPPIKEVTFSGGGGKGVALAGRSPPYRTR